MHALACDATAAGLTAAAVIGHADAIRVGLLGQVRRRWGRRGVRIRQRIQRRRQYRSLFPAVDVGSGRIWHCWIGSMQGSEFCGVVCGIQQAGAVPRYSSSNVPLTRRQPADLPGVRYCHRLSGPQPVAPSHDSHKALARCAEVASREGPVQLLDVAALPTKAHASPRSSGSSVSEMKRAAAVDGGGSHGTDPHRGRLIQQCGPCPHYRD